MSFEKPIPEGNETKTAPLYEMTTSPGSFERERELKQLIRKAEDIVGQTPEHPHSQEFKKGLERDRKALEANRVNLKLRLSKLSPEERSSYIEEHDRLDRTVEAYEKELINFSGGFEVREKVTQELNEFKRQRDVLEKKLPK